MRILSLVPTATEIVCALGASADLVGISHACDFPLDIQTLPRVTSTVIDAEVSSREIDRQVWQSVLQSESMYRLDFELIDQLRPDLILTQSICGVCAVHPEKWSGQFSVESKSRIYSIDAAKWSDMDRTIREIGNRIDREKQSIELIRQLEEKTERLREKAQGCIPVRIAFLEWLDPFYCAGHWTPELVKIAGCEDHLSAIARKRCADLIQRESSVIRSMEVTLDEIEKSEPQAIVVACCGFDPNRAKLEWEKSLLRNDWSKVECVRKGRVVVLDGNAYFNRFGPRLIDGAEILFDTLHGAT